MMGTEKIKHQHHHHHHHQKQPSSSSETSCWRQNCRATGENELHQETYQDPLQDHHRPWQDPFPNCDTETLLHQQDDYDGMEKQQHVTAAVSLGAERSRLRGGREEDDDGIGLQENGPVWIVKAQRYPLRKRETREQQLLRRRGSSVFASMRNTSFLDDAEEHTISSFFRQPLKLQQKKKKKKKRAPSPPAPKRKPRFCTGMNRGKGEDDDDDDDEQQQLQQQRQRGATNKSKKKLSSVLPLLFLSTDETNGLWTRRSSCCKEEDCSGSHRRDCCHLRSCLDPPGPQSVVAAAHHHQRWDEGTGHKKAVVVATPPPPQKCEEEQQGTAYYSSSKTPSMLSTAKIIAKLEAIRAETFDPKKAWSLLKAQKKAQAQSGETYATKQKQHGVHSQTLRMQFNNGKLNGNVHMGRVIKTPETSNPSAFLSAKLQPEHRQKPDNDLQMARERGVLLEKADEVTRSRMCLEGVHKDGDDNDEKEEQLQTSVKDPLFRKERCEKRKIREEYVNLCKITDDPAAVTDSSTIRAPLLAPRRVGKQVDQQYLSTRPREPLISDLWVASDHCPQVCSRGPLKLNTFNTKLESGETEESRIWSERESACREALISMNIYDSCFM
ncbi:unnamed protein product [Sphagnum jensenii]|uniref:Uncharacterized protein n=1 Tax=Sphagnum jensenii TaxID=128206 RepID=A0ABP1C2C7_9BRYO